jgi:hypothetical protein
LILSGAFYPDFKIGVWRRQTYQGHVRPSDLVGNGEVLWQT